ncbi:hypothetical protein GK047_14340 [Paenibacillus sp. SYP-B3998]|uniref:Uncharacterized protein n=1 Tax=Paenibacillus sp. SYP-B3998 TaxID=2678564 RepID=A0A6G3ZZS2_9BACL|nr:hypothetical protein [Paenibacillus sp. SYP-B3998]NEW07184.1 hypothetical protein [Paenibacillus sp. SYP-B3998]
MVRIYFPSIQIDAIAESSSVNKGTNRIIGRRHSLKSNQGLGEMKGEHNVIIGGKYLVQDEDVLDVFQTKRKS